MKKIFLMTVLVVALSLAGCGNKNDKVNTSTENTQTAEEQLENFGKDASKNVNMDKIDGKELKEETTDTTAKAKDKIGSYEVSIEDAKIIDYEDNKVVIVSFGFKNNSQNEINFSGAMVTSLSQNEAELPPVVVTGIEGFDGTTLAQNVSKGEKIKVQRAYKLIDEETPVTVRVNAFDTQRHEGEIEKTFSIQ